VWANREVEYWYQQNALVYIASSRVDLLSQIQSAPLVLDLVHPTTWTRASQRLQTELNSQPGLRLAAEQTVQAVQNTVRARLGRRQSNG
jgi:hypothetical protein